MHMREDVYLNAMLIKAPAKVNLILKITGRRPDGYHELYTLMVPVNLCDTVYVALRKRVEEPGIELRCKGKDVPAGDQNLVWRACEAFYSEIRQQPRVRITLEKVIPVAAGLGGGSSDAAFTLRALNRLYGSPLNHKRLFGIARSLGADIPFFLDPTPCVATGIGDLLEPLEDLPRFWYVIVTPPVKVSTAWAYSEFKFGLTQRVENYILKPTNSVSREVTGLLENDLESVVIARYPEVGQIKETLLRAGAQGAVMSGSGPSVVGVFRTKSEAEKASEQILPDLEADVFVVPVWHGGFE